MDELQVQLAIAAIAKQFGISIEKATLAYLELVRHRSQEIENHLGNELVSRLKKLLLTDPSVADLIHAYHKLKADGGIVPAKLIKDELIYVRSLDFIGNKLFPAGTAIEVTKEWVGNNILEIWIGSDCCSYTNADSVELT